jgi:uncharacterized membrane protein
VRRVWIASAVFAALYVALDVDRYVTYHSGADLGLFAQTVASAFHGFSNTIEGGSHFTFHFSPILYLLAPLLWLTRSPVTLLVIQACATALVAPPLYLIARRRIPEQLAFGVAVVALLYPPLAGVAFSDFHENGLAPAATMWLLWAVDARRWRWATLFLATTLAIKEDQALILAFAGVFGLGYFRRRHDPDGARFAFGAIVASLAVFALYFMVVRPLAGAAHPWEPMHFYADSLPAHRGPEREVLERFTYLLEAFVPLCFACFASPALALAAPGFVELFLSRDPITYTMGQHYAAVWIPYVLAAFALGIARIYRRRWGLAARLVWASIALCVLNLLFLSPTHWTHYLAWRSAHDARLDRVLAGLPPRLKVGTHDEIFAHLGLDPNASLGVASSPQYVLLDQTKTSSYWVERLQPRLHEPRSGYRLEWESDGVALYRRSGANGGI